MEIVSNDTSWGETVAGTATRAPRRASPPRSFPSTAPGRSSRSTTTTSTSGARFDVELRTARRAGARGPAARVLLCSADAHGYPSYRAAFEAFSMHVPVRPTGDAAADGRAVLAALLDGARELRVRRRGRRLGRPARGRRRRPGPRAPPLRRPTSAGPGSSLVRDGLVAGERTPAASAGEAVIPFACEGGGSCPPGDYRVEATWDGRPWIFTNPIRIE